MSLSAEVTNLLVEFDTGINSSQWKIGDVVERDGVKIKIMSGFYRDPVYGRLSNFWTWHRVLKNGKLSKKEYNGYG